MVVPRLIEPVAVCREYDGILVFTAVQPLPLSFQRFSVPRHHLVARPDHSTRSKKIEDFAKFQSRVKFSFPVLPQTRGRGM